MLQRIADVRGLLRDATAQLDGAGCDNPYSLARTLLAQAAGKSREWLTAHDDEVLDTLALDTFDALLKRIIAHEPLAYVLGHREFFGLDLLVDRRVLIPRPETEMLAELALDVLRQGKKLISDLIDVGTGSGAVAIAVAKHAPQTRIIATDISRDALDVARLNAERHGVSDRITFMQADLLEGIEVLPRVITANLPYVTREEIERLPPEIQAHEPRVALDGGEDGLALVRRLLIQVRDMLRRGSPMWLPVGDHAGSPLHAMFLEIGASQGQAALEAATAILPDAHIEIKKDLAKLDRVLCIQF